MFAYFVYPICPGPIGGLKQLRLFAKLTNEIGLPSQLLHDYRDLPLTTDDSEIYGIQSETASVDFAHGQELVQPQDVVILPEHHLDRYLERISSWNCRVGVFVQNGFGGLATRPDPALTSRRLEFAMAISPYTAAIAQDFYRLPSDRVFEIKPWVKRGFFDQAVPVEKDRSTAVAYMPRKLPEHAETIRAIVNKIEPNVEWISIDGTTESGVASALKRSSIFLSTQNREGFGLPAVEAMACGCIVAGYPGTFPFSPPYANPRNGFWARDRNIPAAVRAILKAIRLVRNGGGKYRTMRQCGFETAERYSRGNVVRSLEDLIDYLKTGQRRVKQHHRIGWQGSLGAIYILARKHRLSVSDVANTLITSC